MKFINAKERASLRKKHNHELIKRMREGDPLRSYDSNASWFPPRPIIKKDPMAIAKLYKDLEKEHGEHETQVGELVNISRSAD